MKSLIVTSALLMLMVCSILLVYLRHSVRFSTQLIAPTAEIENITTYHRYNINCNAIYDHDPVEVEKTLVIRRNIVYDEDESLVNLTSNCPRYLRSRGYGDIQVSEMERNFPLAYSILVHKSAWLVERVIRSMYSPTNLYCIHYDQKSPAVFKSAMEGLARCLPNVFIASKLEMVYYAHISRLNADLNCLSDLLASEVSWRYVINLCGQDFPLRSNMELVEELMNLQGTNMLETRRPEEDRKERYKFHHKLGNYNFEYRKLPLRTNQAKDPPPEGIEMYMGSAYFVLTREFITYVHSSPIARDFLVWLEDTFCPEELYWATLTRMPGVPGEVPRTQADVTDLMSKARLVKWSNLEGIRYPPCTGTHVRYVCIFGAVEIHWLLNYGHWFANKVDPKVDPIIVQCLEEKLMEKEMVLREASQVILD